MERALTPEQVAKRWECSEQHVRALYHKGELRGFRVGRLLRFTDDAVRAYEGRAEEKLSAFEKWKRSRESKLARTA